MSPSAAGRRLGLPAALVLLLPWTGCGDAPDAPGGSPAAGPESSAGAPSPDATPTAPAFAEVARQVGIDFVHNDGATGRKWLPETMGSGCAWVDYDGDGDADALLLSGKSWPGDPRRGRQTPGLYRNDGGRFVDVTESAGLAEPTYAIGVTAGDYDADGDLDLYVTALGANRLYRNDGGRFRDVAPTLGVDHPGFGSAAAFLDYDADGDLDLFVLNYVQWSPETDLYCSLDGTNKSYCTPESYDGASPVLYRNDGGRFTDVSRAAGVHDPTAKALGLAVLDFDADGWTDLFVANDTQPNMLFRNRGDGTFSEEGLIAGVAFDESGHARGAMGVDAGDYDGSGRPSLVIGNFSNEMLALYQNQGMGLFIDAAPVSGLGASSLLTLAFGTLFLDFDLDGRLDIFVANGHVENDIQRVQASVTYAEPPHLFRNRGGGAFDDVAPQVEALREPMVARGAAAGDFDGDGDPDLLVNSVAGPARLLRNDGARAAALRVRLLGSGRNRDAYGSVVRAAAPGVARTAWLRSAHSYCSRSEAVLTFGLGAQARMDSLTVRWPSGDRLRFRALPAGEVVLREEPAGRPVRVTRTAPAAAGAEAKGRQAPSSD